LFYGISSKFTQILESDQIVTGDIPATFQKALQIPLDRMKQFTTLIEKVACLFPAVSVTSMTPVNHDTCQS